MAKHTPSKGTLPTLGCALLRHLQTILDLQVIFAELSRGGRGR